MFNLYKFISDSVTFRPVSIFAPNIEANKEKLTEEIKGKKLYVIGCVISIGSSIINNLSLSCSGMMEQERIYYQPI